MGFWQRLFGERETPAQRIERARFHLDEHEPQLAVRAVERLSGPEVDEIRRRAHDMADALDARAAERPPGSIGPDADDPLRVDRIDRGVDRSDRGVDRIDRSVDRIDRGDHSGGRSDRRDRSGDRGDRGDRSGDRSALGGGPYREPGRRAKPPKQPKQPKRSNPAPGGMFIQFGGDGSTTVALGGGSTVTLNAPVSDDDGRPRSSDGVEVARRLLASTGHHDLDPRAFAFVDAACLLARAGEPMPRLGDPRRRAVAALAVAANTRDPDRVAAAIRAGTPDVAEDLARFATPLAVRFAAKELGALALQGLVNPTAILVEALVANDPATCMRLVEQAGDPLFAGEARLMAEAAGVDAAFAWVDWREATAQADAWRALEIRRLVRHDLEAALALEETHASEVEADHTATFELARALAKVDPSRALAKLRGFTPSVDDAGWLAGVVRAGIGGVGDIVDRWIDAIGPGTYHPYGHFAEVLAVCVELGDVERARRCIAKAGPTGWQIACAARDALAHAADRAALLAACYERVPAGVVAGRAIPYGALPFAAGTVVFQPAWLAFTEPHPIETLAIVAALGPDGPYWSTR